MPVIGRLRDNCQNKGRVVSRGGVTILDQSRLRKLTL